MKRYKRGTLLYGDLKIEVNLYKQNGDVFVIFEGEYQEVFFNKEKNYWVF